MLWVLMLVFLIFGSFVVAKLLELSAAVENIRGTTQSAVALIADLARKIEECQGDPEALAALVADLRESSDSLAAAVAANSTPADPDPLD